MGSTSDAETGLISVLSFFGLLLPGMLGTLYFLGVPLTQVYLAGASLVTMYFLTGITDRLIIKEKNFSSGQGKSLEDESLVTEILLNILELLEAINEVVETIQD